jgi:hypothetical protein
MAEFDAEAVIAKMRAREQERTEPRPQPERERNPTYYEKTREAEGNSNWSGGSMGGGVWGGRDRHR